jgi:hypothetical protein
MGRDTAEMEAPTDDVGYPGVEPGQQQRDVEMGDPSQDAFGPKDTNATNPIAAAPPMAAAGAVGCCQVLVWIGLGVFWLVLYFEYDNWNDICRYPLPTWCLVNGIGALASIPLAVLSSIATHRQQAKMAVEKTSALYMCMTCTGCLITIFHLVWFILGNVWSWGQDKTQCSPVLLDICRTYLIIVYCLLGFVCLCICCCVPVLTKFFRGWASD